MIWKKISDYLQRQELFWARLPILALADSITDEDAYKISSQYLINEYWLREISGQLDFLNKRKEEAERETEGF